MTSRAHIDLEADIQPVTDFRANAAAMLDQVKETGRPIVLTQRGRSAAVVLDIRSYQALLDALDELQGILRGIREADAGTVVEHDEARQQILESLQ